MSKNKRGWIKVVEAFVSILLIVGVLIVLVNQRGFEKEDSGNIYIKENSALREIGLNKTLRNQILNLEPLPIEWEALPSDIKNKISNIESYLECNARLCDTNDICEPGNYTNKDIYARSVFISSNTTKYSPRQLKIFCWER